MEKITRGNQILEIIKSNKIGKGCKIEVSYNKLFIKYPIGKTIGEYWKNIPSQYTVEIAKVKELLPGCGVNCYKYRGSGGINIWMID